MGRPARGRAPALAAWRAAGKVAWLAVVDGAASRTYARDAASRSIRDRTVGAERRTRASFLLDWDGVLAERLDAQRGRVALVLLSRDRPPFRAPAASPRTKTSHT